MSAAGAPASGHHAFTSVLFPDIVGLEYGNVGRAGEPLHSLSVFWCPLVPPKGGCCGGGSSGARSYSSATFVFHEPEATEAEGA